MARPDDLVPGNCYFSLTYYDNDLLLPLIETRVYVGQPERNPAVDAELTGLDREIIKFLDDDDCAALTITIRYTDGGLSLGRDEVGLHFSFSTRPMIDPGHDTGIQVLFAALNAVAVSDYFADDGRTHMLKYPCPREPNEIVQLCRRILIEVYAMRRGDVLDFAPVGKRIRSTREPTGLSLTVG